MVMLLHREFSCAVLIDTFGRFLLQQRDNVPGIVTRGESTTAPLLLLRLMLDLEVLEEELRTAQDTKGQLVWTHQDPLAERLRRAGVGDEKIEDFIAWRRTISSLTTDDSRDENQLAKIVAAEATGLTLFAELI